MIVRLLTAAIALGLCAPAQAAMTCSTSNISAVSINTATGAGNETKTVSLPSDAPAGATLYLGLLNRTDETTTLSSVSDPVNGSWTLGANQIGPVDSAGSTGRAWMVHRLNTGAITGGANRVITFTTSAGVSTQARAWWCSDDVGALTLDTTSAALHNDAANDTNHDTTTLAVAGAGGIVGLIASNNAFTSNYTADGAGEAMVNGAPGAGDRLAVIFEATSGAGNVGFEFTSTPTLQAFVMVGSYLTPGGGGGSTTARNCPLLGVCE